MHATIASSISPKGVTLHVPNSLRPAFLEAVSFYSLRAGCSGTLTPAKQHQGVHEGYTSYTASQAFVDKVLHTAFSTIANPIHWKGPYRAAVPAHHVPFLHFVADWFLANGLQSVHTEEGNPFTAQVTHLGYNYGEN